LTTRIRIVRGARAGEVLDFADGDIRVGRHAEADLRFDPEADRAVSSRHAVLLHQDGRWLVRDLGSTNGTFVNGRRIDGDVELRNGDRIGFGGESTLVEFEPEPEPVAPGTRTQVVRAEMGRQNRRLRATALLLAVALIVTASALIVSSRRARGAWQQERATLLARIDSVLERSDAAVASLQGEVQGVAEALRASQEEVRATRAALQQTASDGGGQTVEQLRRQLRSATEALNRQQLAASLDFRAIESANRHAIAMIFVESEDGIVSTATGFAVRPDATIVTSAHVLVGPDGNRRARRVAVQFSDSEQYFPATVLTIADGADIAVIRAGNIDGGVPVVRGLNTRTDTIAAGQPVAVIGFPLGGETGMPGAASRAIARPLVSAGIVTAADADRIEARGYGAAGASGSPIFDGEGNVIAVLFGGRNGEAGHTLVAVPGAVVSEVVRRVR
jgi:V8-like Glu-specific endopeptidase